ncbi:hypothetical protein [Macrococcoides caseolyticum]|uniref:hypothetical protein n=1 Tax=Macrococcoides caseolyticum TaxID=69966 RepID=UPI00030872C3|nr:hypothetical protein [Macrococcus caseolyticus]
MSKQVAKYDQLKDVYVFMNENKEMVVIKADVVEQCVDQKIKANQWIEKESNEYHEEMKKAGGK